MRGRYKIELIFGADVPMLVKIVYNDVAVTMKISRVIGPWTLGRGHFILQLE
jgi:hypothetical protein